MYVWWHSGVIGTINPTRDSKIVEREKDRMLASESRSSLVCAVVGRPEHTNRLFAKITRLLGGRRVHVCMALVDKDVLARSNRAIFVRSVHVEIFCVDSGGWH